MVSVEEAEAIVNAYKGQIQEEIEELMIDNNLEDLSMLITRAQALDNEIRFKYTRARIKRRKLPSDFYQIVLLCMLSIINTCYIYCLYHYFNIWLLKCLLNQ